jgi:hypothetical protein
MWWMNQEAAFAAWTAAISEAGLTWKYRKVLGGEWNTLEHLGDARYRKQGLLFVIVYLKTLHSLAKDARPHCAFDLVTFHDAELFRQHF